MNSNYKLNKYIHKLKNAENANQMNMYYRKLVQYKFPQEGGQQFKIDAQNAIKNFNEKIKNVQGQFNTQKEQLLRNIEKSPILKSLETSEIALGDSLQTLNEILNNLNNVDVSITESIENVKPNLNIEPLDVDKYYEAIKNQNMTPMQALDTLGRPYRRTTIPEPEIMTTTEEQ